MAKIGDFAIVRLSNGRFNRKGRPLGYDEVPCLITERTMHKPNNQTFIYWKTSKSGKLIVDTGSLPKDRFKSVEVTLADVNGLFDEAAQLL